MPELDVTGLIGAVEREVIDRERDGNAVKVVRASRTYRAAINEVWDAITNPERIPRWFLPVSGDLAVGGRFQLEGNAAGEILVCEPPRRLSVTWEYGGDVSWLEVALSAEGEETTRLVLEHSARPMPEMWDQFGPGAVGVGWDLALLGLGTHLETGDRVDPEMASTFHTTPDGREFIERAAKGWGQAVIGSGGDPEAARAAADRTRAFYLGEDMAPGG